MTNREAIKILVDVIEPPILRADGRSAAALSATEAIHMAVKALQAEPNLGEWEQAKVTTEVMESLGCRYDAKVYRCSHCGSLERVRSTYCPICGARMW